MQTEIVLTATDITVFDFSMSTEVTLSESHAMQYDLLIDLHIREFLDLIIREIQNAQKTDFHTSVDITYGSTHFRVKVKRYMKISLVAFIGYGSITQSIETLVKHSEELISFMERVFNSSKMSPKEFYMFTRNPSELECLLKVIEKITQYEQSKYAIPLSVNAAKKYEIIKEIKNLYQEANEGVRQLILDSISEEFKFEILKDQDKI